jgi:microcystin-dependent protein
VTVVSPYGTSVEEPGEQLPVGSLLAWHSNTPPNDRYLLCDGGQVLIASYPRLYALLTTTYGPLTDGSGGAGSTHFSLPDLDGRFLMQAASNAELGSTGGTEAHQHVFTTSQSSGNVSGGSHTHTHTSGNLNSFDHSHNGSYGTAGSNVLTNVLRATGGSTARSFDIHTHTYAINTSTVGHGHAISGTNTNATGDGPHGHTLAFSNAAATVNDSPAARDHVPRHLLMKYLVYAGAI